ncbi:MAG: ABC transporter ATP-binding protein/permease [Ruminococcus sp.]|nr:ABC transporter ATP-binding protein/permease [Ruminococcus sp.]MCM1381594.1 ABC transporter ATP-binding protein/permease [Muribaculaceae bacterium]MCM1478652.1 ABC transporter ATP-binding protein/permease [Muribaculaceae bacterium]
MIKILKHLGKSWVWVPVIFALLVAQAVCDLALPQYTSDIVDVGIQQGGIESAALEEISPISFEKLLMFDKSGMLTKYYVYKWDSVSNARIGYEAETVEPYITYPAAVVYALDHADMSALAEAGGDTAMAMQLPEGMTVTDMLLAMPKEQRTPIIEEINKQFEGYSEIMLSQMAVEFAREELISQGADMDSIQMSYILGKGIEMTGLALAIMLVTIVVGFLAARIAALFGMNVREKVFRRVVSFSNAEMDKFSTASLITRSTNDIQQVQMVIVMILRMVLYAPILGIGGVIKVARTGTGLGWIIFVAVAAILVLVSILMVVAMPKFKSMQKLVDRLNLVTREILTGLPVIRAFSREKHEEERFDEASKNLMKTQLFTNRVMSVMSPFMTMIMNGISVLIVWFGTKGIDSGDMQVGDMMAFLTYTMQIVMSFLMLTMISIMLPRAAVSANRINEVLETNSSVLDRENAANEGITQGKVVFDNVSFHYDGSDEDVLRNISFTANPGETTAIIGSTGSGKSTLINLIPRFFDTTEGTVTVDGVNVRDFSMRYLRENIGIVPQKGVLFSGTIKSNLSFGCENATAEQLAEAAEIAQATEFIEAKPERYESPISQGGTNVSGGQKQRLSIARAIAKKPKIYIFDDSFSALDYKTDAALRKALSEKVANSTVIIVAQRISTILHAERIVVLDEGGIAGIGTHSELLKNCEVYKQIASSQLSEEELNSVENGKESE